MTTTRRAELHHPWWSRERDHFLRCRWNWEIDHWIWLKTTVDHTLKEKK